MRIVKCKTRTRNVTIKIAKFVRRQLNCNNNNNNSNKGRNIPIAWEMISLSLLLEENGGSLSKVKKNNRFDLLTYNRPRR